MARTPTALETFFHLQWQDSASTNLQKRPIAQLTGPGVALSDDEANNRTIVTIAGGGGALTPQFVTALRGVAPSAAKAVQHSDGFAAQSDGGEGLWVWDDTSVAADDAGTIIQHTGTAIGRWRRVFEGLLSVGYYGIVGDGTTDQTAALATVDAQAVALGCKLHFPKGTYSIANNLTLSSDVSMAPGAVLKVASGKTLTLAGTWPANLSQQLFTPTSTIRISTSAGNKPLHLSIKYWGAVGDGNTDDTTAIRSAIATFQDASQHAVSCAPELVVPPGRYRVMQSANTDYGPVLEIVNASGRVRGAGNGQSVIYMQGIAGTSVNTTSPKATVQLTNCSYLEWEGVDVIHGTPFAPTLSSATAVGATTITIPDATTGGQLPSGAVSIPVTLHKYPYYAEDVNITNVATSVGITTLTLDRPLQYAYDAGSTNGINYVLFSTKLCMVMHRDQAQPGNSTQNYVHDCSFGNSSIINCLYYAGTTCEGGTGSTSDVNNDLHVFERCRGANAVWAGVYIGHLNSIGIVFRDCALRGTFYGLHCPQGGTWQIEGNTSIDGQWGTLALGGGCSHSSKMMGCLSEAGGPLLVANAWIPNASFVKTAFTQPAVSSNVKVYVGSNTTWPTPGNVPAPYIIAVGGGGYYQYVSSGSDGGGPFVNLTNLGAADNAAPGATIPAGRNIGLALRGSTIQLTQYDSQSGPTIKAVTASASAGTSTLTLDGVRGLRIGQKCALSSPNGSSLESVTIAGINVGTNQVTLLSGTSKAHTSLTGGAYGYLSPLYHIDMQGSINALSAVQCRLTFGQGLVPGNEIHAVDVKTTGSRISLVESDIGVVGWTLENAFLRYIGAGLTAGVSFGVPSNTPVRETYIGSGAAFGVDGHQADTLGDQPYLPGAARGLIPQVIRVQHSDSPYTLTLDAYHVVDTSGGSVILNMPSIPKWHGISIKHDASTGLGESSVTVNAAGGQTLEQPGLTGVFGTSYVIATVGTEVSWRNINSGVSPEALALVGSA